jgi:hypothetical protein
MIHIAGKGFSEHLHCCRSASWRFSDAPHRDLRWLQEAAQRLRPGCNRVAGVNISKVMLTNCGSTHAMGRHGDLDRAAYKALTPDQ